MRSNFEKKKCGPIILRSSFIFSACVVSAVSNLSLSYFSQPAAPPFPQTLALCVFFSFSLSFRASRLFPFSAFPVSPLLDVSLWRPPVPPLLRVLMCLRGSLLLVAGPGENRDKTFRVQGGGRPDTRPHRDRPPPTTVNRGLCPPEGGARATRGNPDDGLFSRATRLSFRQLLGTGRPTMFAGYQLKGESAGVFFRGQKTERAGPIASAAMGNRRNDRPRPGKTHGKKGDMAQTPGWGARGGAIVPGGGWDKGQKPAAPWFGVRGCALINKIRGISCWIAGNGDALRARDFR